ncbi:MAG TPA: hypothetical protein VK766_10495 [Cytophagaceae bacterium]|jgi:hypothetical protein|nr:hypothetical protein [Cytophagaceae bacterium]
MKNLNLFLVAAFATVALTSCGGGASTSEKDTTKVVVDSVKVMDVVVDSVKVMDTVKVDTTKKM